VIGREGEGRQKEEDQRREGGRRANGVGRRTNKWRRTEEVHVGEGRTSGSEARKLRRNAEGNGWKWMNLKMRVGNLNHAVNMKRKLV
jgi:hypothetical protein